VLITIYQYRFIKRIFINEKLKQEIKNKIRIIPNFLKLILFQDVTSITDNSDLFKIINKRTVNLYKKNKISKIAEIEAVDLFLVLSLQISAIYLLYLLKKR